ncbi:hypothetical protein ACIA59_24030 [Micromonospora haikouensis]|uniref:hypothetical protein n=1 Tax=Micromonospora haikouensis TaxID=686309 RepID=UPI0037920350
MTLPGSLDRLLARVSSPALLAKFTWSSRPGRSGRTQQLPRLGHAAAQPTAMPPRAYWSAFVRRPVPAD